jgi:RNA polymerase sigma-70 factor (ECF subfamily)
MTNDLIDRWVAGDPGAAEEIYRVYYRRAREFARTLGARLNDAEDIAQEALIAGLEGLKGGKRPDRFTHWLLGIARHVTARKFQPKAGPVPDVVDPRGRGGRTLAVRREMNGLLDETLGRLPEAQREVLDLIHRGGLSRKEAADRLDLPLEAVHARCERAYARLREALSRHFTTIAVQSMEPGAVRLEDIRALRPAFRDAIVARHLEGLDEDAAAARLGIPAATLRARLRSAYEILKTDESGDFSKAREEHRKGR